MKAKDYYKKYRNEIVSKDEKKSIEAIANLVKDLSEEAKETIKLRRVRTDSGAVAVIREMNQKYNAVVTLFEKEFGASPLLRNGFREYWKKQVPELKRFM